MFVCRLTLDSVYSLHYDNLHFVRSNSILLEPFTFKKASLHCDIFYCYLYLNAMFDLLVDSNSFDRSSRT